MGPRPNEQPAGPLLSTSWSISTVAMVRPRERDRNEALECVPRTCSGRGAIRSSRKYYEKKQQAGDRIRRLAKEGAQVAMTCLPAPGPAGATIAAIEW